MEVQGTSIFGQRCLFEWEDLFYGMKHNVQCTPKIIQKNSQIFGVHNVFSAKKEKCRDLLSEEISCVSILISNHLPKRPQSLRVLGGPLLEVQLLYPSKVLRESLFLFEWSPL